MSNGNNSEWKGESFTSASRLSALAPPFNLKTHDQQLSFNPFSLDNPNLEVVNDYNYGCYVPYDDPFGNETNSLHFQYTLKSEANLLDSDAKLANKFSQPASYTHDSSYLGDDLGEQGRSKGKHGATSSMACKYNSFFEQDENALSYLPEYNSSQAQKIRSSGANSTLLLHKLGLSDNLDSWGDDAVIKEKYSGLNCSTIMEPHALLNAKDQMVCHEKIPIDKGKEKQNGETVINEAIDTLVMAKMDLSPDVPGTYNFESHNTESGLPVQNSSLTFDENDSDVDSPCWKGTGVYQSAFQVPGPVSSVHPKVETRRSLNPMAPDFFPGSAKPVVECLENKCEGNDFSSFKKAASSVVLLSKECRLMDCIKAGTCPSEVSNIIETQFSNNVHNAGKMYSLAKKSNRSSVFNSSFSDGPCPVGEHCTSSGQGWTGANFLGPVDDSKPSIFNGSTSVSFPTTGNLFTTFSSRDVVSSEFDETLRGASKSAPPKINVQTVINTMHDLSELLRWNYSNALDPINEDEHDMIHHIIDNLSVCITNEVGQRVSISESGQPCTSYCPQKLTGCQKVARMKPVAVAHDWEKQKSSSTKFSKKVTSSSSSRSNEGVKKADEVAQIIGNARKEEHQIAEEINPQPLRNENLWLEAEASPFYDA